MFSTWINVFLWFLSISAIIGIFKIAIHSGSAKNRCKLIVVGDVRVFLEGVFPWGKYTLILLMLNNAYGWKWFDADKWIGLAYNSKQIFYSQKVCIAYSFIAFVAELGEKWMSWNSDWPICFQFQHEALIKQWEHTRSFISLNTLELDYCPSKNKVKIPVAY